MKYEVGDYVVVDYLMPDRWYGVITLMDDSMFLVRCHRSINISPSINEFWVNDDCIVEKIPSHDVIIRKLNGTLLV